MKIYDITNNAIADVPVVSQAVHEEEMMKSNFVRLSWKSNVKTRLAAGTYIIPFADGLRYRLTEPYDPTQESEDTFTYQPEFQHPTMWLGKVPFTYATKNTSGEDVVQQEWEYTGLTLNILQYAVDFINAAFGLADKEKFALTPVGGIDTNVSLSFSSTDVLSALSAIANGCEVNRCEWHLSWEHKALYFGQVSVNLGEPVPTLKVGGNVGKASVTQGKEGYYNVFYPQGSTRNMSSRAASGENVSTGIRLGLDKTRYPNGEIDTRDNANEPKQTLAMTFDDVYPHVDCYVYNVRKRIRHLLDDDNDKVVSEYNPDGTVKSYKTYTVWYMRLAYPLTSPIGGKTPVATTTEKLNGVSQTLYWYDYEVDDKQVMDGYTLCGSFSANTNEGALGSTLVGQPGNGDGFELRYHKSGETIAADEATGDSGVSILKGDYEIVFVNQNDTIIPTNEKEGLIPRGEETPSVKGNIVILYNIAMGDEEVAAAQDELERKALAEIAYRQSDRNNYTFAAYPDVFAKANPRLYIGQRVRYDDGNGYSYTTRVLKLTTNLDYDICQEITVGNSSIKGSQTQLKEDVQGLISGTISVGSGLSYEQVVNICKNYVSTRYLSRTHADTAQGVIRFLQGLRVGDGDYGIDGKGEAALARIVAKELMSQLDVNDDLIGGKGFHYWLDTDGRSHVMTDYFTARVKAFFAELEIRKVSASTGNMVFSNAGSRLAHVEDYERDGFRGWKCWFETDDGTTATTNSWEIGDQAQCRTFNVKEGVHGNASNRYYWRLVIGKGEGKILDKDGLPVDDKTYGYVILADRYTDADGHDTTLVGTLTDGEGNEILPYGATDGGKAYFRLKQTEDSAHMPEGWTLNDAPETGDSIVQLGCQTAEGVASRGNAMQIVTNGEDGTAVPSLNMYSAVNDYDLSRFRVVQISPKGIVATVRMADIKIVNTAGKPVSLFNFVGAYPTDGTRPTVYKGDVYTYEGQTWAWDGADGATPEPPSETVAGWTIVASKGDDGSATMDYYEMTAEPGFIHIASGGYHMADDVNIYLWHVQGTKRTQVTDEGTVIHVYCGNLDDDFSLPITLSTTPENFKGCTDDDGQESADDNATQAQLLYEDIKNGATYVTAYSNIAGISIPILRDGSPGKDSVPSSVSKYAASAYNASTVKGNTHGGIDCPKDIANYVPTGGAWSGWTWGGWSDSATPTDAKPYVWMLTVPLNEEGKQKGSASYVCMTGAKGDTGAAGLSLEIYYGISQYATSASADNPPPDLGGLFKQGTADVNTDSWRGILPGATTDRPYQWAASVLMNPDTGKNAGNVIYYRVNVKDGEPGRTPKIEIGENGNWFVDEKDTEIKAQGDKGDPGEKGDDAVTYEIVPVTEQAAVSIEKTGDASDRIRVTGTLDVNCKYTVYMVKGGVRTRLTKNQGCKISTAAFNDGSTTGLVIDGNGVTGSGISYSSTDGRTSVIVTYAYGSETIGVRTVPVTFAPASMIEADQERWTQVYANGESISALQQDAESIRLKVDGIGGIPSRNLMSMGDVGEVAVTGQSTVWGPRKVAVTAGRQYTVTWRGRVGNAAAYVKFYAGVGNWGASSGPYSSTENGTFRHVFKPTESGEMSVYVQYVDRDNAFPSSFPHTVYTEWVRVDEGDRVTREADRITEWEPSDADIEAVNLLPDHLLENAAKAYSDALGTRDVAGSDDASEIVGVDAEGNAWGVAHVRFTRSGVYAGNEITGGLRWYVPFRGAGDYTISASVKDLGGVTSTDGNYVYMELHACDSGRNRIRNKYGLGWWQNKNYRGWYFREGTAHVGDTETDSGGNLKSVEWLEVRLFMTRDGDMAVSRLCLSKCGHATLWDAQERSDARGNEAAQLATGLDIYNRRIRAVADMFEWWSNGGGRFAYYDAARGVAVFDGEIHAAGGSFTGDVTATTFTGPGGAFRVLGNGAAIATGMTDYGNFYVCQGPDGTDILAVHSASPVAGGAAAVAFYYGARLDNDGNPQSDRVKVSSGGGRNLLIAGGANSLHFPMADNNFGSSDGAGPFIGVGKDMNSLSPSNLVASLLNGHLLATPKVLTDKVDTAFMKAGAVRFGVETHYGGFWLYGDSAPIHIAGGTSPAVYLPSSPEKGMVFVVVNDAGTVTFYGNGKQFYSNGAKDTVSSGSRGEWSLFAYDGSYWRCVYVNGRF